MYNYKRTFLNEGKKISNKQVFHGKLRSHNMISMQVSFLFICGPIVYEIIRNNYEFQNYKKYDYYIKYEVSPL